MAKPKPKKAPPRVDGTPVVKPVATPKPVKTPRRRKILAGPPEDQALVEDDDDVPEDLKQLLSFGSIDWADDEAPTTKKTSKQKENTDMSKNTWDVPRGSAPNMFDPSDLVILGIDTEDGQAAVLVDITERHHKASIEILAKNIIACGQIHPVSINKDGNKAVVTAGRRRVLAFRMINEWVKKKDPRAGGLKEPLRISCTTKRGSEADQMFLMVSENEHAIADTPMSKARKANRLLALNKTEDEVAIAFGVTRQAIENWKKLADLHQDVQKAVDKGVIPASAAMELAVLPRDEQAKKFAELSTNAAALAAAAPTNGKRNGKITARTVRAAARGQESPRPGIRAVQKIIEAVKADELKVSDIDPLKLMKWFVGEVPTSQLKGFTKVIES